VYNVVLHAFVPFETNNPSYIAFRKSPWPTGQKVWILLDITFKEQVEKLGVSSTLFQRLEGIFGGDFFGIIFSHLNTISTLATSTHVHKNN
jgi:hypothetical protein